MRFKRQKMTSKNFNAFIMAVLISTYANFQIFHLRRLQKPEFKFSTFANYLYFYLKKLFNPKKIGIKAFK